MRSVIDESYQIKLMCAFIYNKEKKTIFTPFTLGIGITIWPENEKHTMVPNSYVRCRITSAHSTQFTS